MILKQNTFSLVVETESSSEISSVSLSNPFRESGTSRNKIPKLRAARVFVFKMIDNLSRAIDFYWSINNVWHFGGSAMVAGLLLKGSWFSSRRFSLPSPSPSFDFCAHPLVPGSARLKNPRWRSISERKGFSAMKSPVTACKQASIDWNSASKQTSRTLAVRSSAIFREPWGQNW